MRSFAAVAGCVFALSLVVGHGSGQPAPDRQKVVDAFLPLLKKSGDVKVGKMVFTKHCAVCHVHGSEGSRVGPDLTSIVTLSRQELLLRILDPNRNVEGKYRLY